MTDTAPITVCIGTYGNEAHWSELAHRAMASVERQTLAPANLVWVDGPNLHAARNEAAAKADSDWLCFLDADDELDPGYLEAMTRVARTVEQDTLLQPATLGVHPDGHEDPEPVVIPSKPLLDGNFMVIGTLIRTSQFRRLGGFSEWPCWEDWELWLRAWIDGADLRCVPAAVYRVHVNEGGRNNGDRATQLRTYETIRALHRSGVLARGRGR